MNWIPEQKILELKEAMARNEAAQSVNILYELERDFNRVFAGDSHTEFSGRRGKAGEHVRSPRLSHDRKNSSE